MTVIKYRKYFNPWQALIKFLAHFNKFEYSIKVGREKSVSEILKANGILYIKVSLVTVLSMMGGRHLFRVNIYTQQQQEPQLWPGSSSLGMKLYHLRELSAMMIDSPFCSYSFGGDLEYWRLANTLAFIFSWEIGAAGEIIFYHISIEVRPEEHESLIFQPWLLCWNLSGRSFNLSHTYSPHRFKYYYPLPLPCGRSYNDNLFMHKTDSCRNTYSINIVTIMA